MGTITKVRVFWVAKKNPYLTETSHPKKYLPYFTTPKNPLIILVTWNLDSPTPPPPPPLPGFWSQNGMDFADFAYRVWFSRELWKCMNVFIISVPNERKKEKYANSKWILTNLFCCSSNLSKDYFISYRAGLKRVWITIFFGLKEVRIWRTGWHTPTKNSQDNPPGLFLHKKSSYAWHTVVMQSLCRMLV